jgi:hypothetical protein
VERRHKLKELVAEVVALRDQLDRVRRESEALCRIRRLAIQQSRQLVRSNSSKSEILKNFERGSGPQDC